LVLALLLRLGNARFLPGQGSELVISDMYAYDRAATAFLHQTPLGVHTVERFLYHPLGSDTYRPPGYYYFLAGVYALAGHHYWAVRVVQAVLDTLTCALVYSLGKHLAGESVGRLSAAITAVYLPLVVYTGMLLSETLSTFLLVASGALLMRLAQPGDRLPWAQVAVVGVVLGLVGLVRSVLLVMAPVAVGWLLFIVLDKAGWRQRLRYGLTLLIPILLVIAPVTVRNYQLHDELILVSTNGGVNFFLGHGGNENLKRAIRNIPDDPVPGQLIGISGRTAPEEEALFYHLGWEYILQSPVRTLRQIPGKVRELYWSSEYWPAQESQLQVLRLTDWALWRLTVLPLALVGPLVLSGLVVRRALLLYGCVAAMLIVPLVFWAQPRFRVPVVPFFIALASATAVALARRAKLMVPILTRRAVI
jgi:4-amino-4-deoxy-L-arabinose transferase-like glycosyltransferase